MSVTILGPQQLLIGANTTAELPTVLKRLGVVPHCDRCRAHLIGTVIRKQPGAAGVDGRWLRDAIRCKGANLFGTMQSSLRDGLDNRLPSSGC